MLLAFFKPFFFLPKTRLESMIIFSLNYWNIFSGSILSMIVQCSYILVFIVLEPSGTMSQSLFCCCCRISLMGHSEESRKIGSVYDSQVWNNVVKNAPKLLLSRQGHALFLRSVVQCFARSGLNHTFGYFMTFWTVEKFMSLLIGLTASTQIHKINQRFNFVLKLLFCCLVTTSIQKYTLLLLYVEPVKQKLRGFGSYIQHITIKKLAYCSFNSTRVRKQISYFLVKPPFIATTSLFLDFEPVTHLLCCCLEI